MSAVLPQIKHIVVAMLENRSLDNMCGWLYSDGKVPALTLPAGSPAGFNGLTTAIFNPSNADFFAGAAAKQVLVTKGVSSSTVPDPDPQETFVNVTEQLFGRPADPASRNYPMLGFLVNYAGAPNVSSPNQIMQAHAPAQLPVLSQLALSYAISDAWFASVPSQTWPNRAFAHAGTSNGNVDNGSPPDPLKWDVPTIFNVLESQGVAWSVYGDTLLTPSLTRTMFPRLWGPELSDHFRGFHEFEDGCASNALPAYTFLEPSFIVDPNDAHPPHDVEAAEQFLFRIWNAVRASPGWNETLLIVTFDEHGGCHDHVLPPFGAAAPDQASSPGEQGFAFDRFGVRVPTILISPYIQAGTVFRSPTNVAFDHTSILATLRDWLKIPPNVMLPSRRIASAPLFDQVLTLSQPRLDSPTISPLNAPVVLVPAAAEPNDLQRSLVAGTARRLNTDPGLVLSNIQSRQQAADYFRRQPSMINK